MVALMRACADGQLAGLEWLSLGENQISAVGMQALGDAVDAGHLPAIEKIVIYGNKRGQKERAFEQAHPHNTGPWRWAYEPMY